MLKLSWNLWTQLGAQEELCQNLLFFVCSMLFSVLLNLLNFFSQAIHRYCSSVLGMQKALKLSEFRLSPVEWIRDLKGRSQNSEIFFRYLKHLKKEISKTELINHLLHQAGSRKSQACNRKCINNSTRLNKSLPNFNFSEKEQDDI